MGLMTNFKFWLIVGNRTQPNEAFCPGPGPLIYIDYSELVSSRPLAVTKIERERECVETEGKLGAGQLLVLFARTQKQKWASSSSSSLLTHSLSFHFVCCSSLFFWILKFRFFNFKLTFFYFIHSYRWIWFVRVRENI